MIHVQENSNKTIHGTYKSKEMTLKVLLPNKRLVADSLKRKVEIFQETDDAVLTTVFNNKDECTLKLEKDSGTYAISFTKKIIIKKENMDMIEKMLLDMSNAVSDTTELLNSSSSTNLLLDSSVSLSSLQ